MLSPMSGAMLLREVPSSLIRGVQTGEIKVYGSIIRSVSTGRIVGHLQETSGLTRIVGELLAAPLGVPLQAASIGIDVLGHGISYIQNEQIKMAIEALRHLQVFDIALGAAGIGISIAGFAVVSQKVRRIEAQIEEMRSELDQIARGVEGLRQERIADDFTRLKTAIEQMDEAWKLSDPVAQWRDVARETHRLSNAFERRASEVLEDPGADELTAEPFLDALALASANRVAARLAAGDDAVARQAAQDGAQSLMKLGRRMHFSRLILSRAQNGAAEFGSAKWGEELHQIADEMRPVFAANRRREAAAAATVLTLDELEQQQISGRYWLEVAREQYEAPLLYLDSWADVSPRM